MCSLVFGAHRVVFFLIFFFLRKKPKTWGHRDLHFVESGWRARLGLPTSNPGHGIVLVGFCPLLKRSVCWFSELSSNSFVCLLANNKSTCLISFTNERWIYRFTEPFKKLNNLFMVLVCHFLSLPGFFDVKHFSRWIGVFGIATFCCCFFFPKFLTFFRSLHFVEEDLSSDIIRVAFVPLPSSSTEQWKKTMVV